MTIARDEYDVVVVGSGVGGLATALALFGLRSVALVTSGPLGGGSTAWAQGGLAAAIGPDDSAALHALDTVAAGDDFGDSTAIQILTETAPNEVADLLRRGALLDRDEHGQLALTREGGHSRRRIVHAGGDASGAEVSRSLTAAVRASEVEVFEDTTVHDLTTCNTAGARSVTGVVVRGNNGQERTIGARAVVLATGGVGGLFATSTNPAEVTGAGLGLALRAGAALADLEFIQFHPTALDTVPATGQVPLMTEALRGEGAVLRDERGGPVMKGRHRLGDLAPRDVVARRVEEVQAGGGNVFLDTTAIPDLAERFPTIVTTCIAQGIDPATEWIPVAPTQHFMCGGVRTDEWGATDVVGLFAVGEVAATGVHGANRLASNSLIEGLVFASRIAARLAHDLPARTPSARNCTAPRSRVGVAALPRIRRVVSDSAGIRRTGAGLDSAAKSLAAIRDTAEWCDPAGEGADPWLAALAIVLAATARRESRGCHSRTDHPASSEWWRRRRIVVRLGDDGVPVASVEPISDHAGQLEQSA